MSKKEMIKRIYFSPKITRVNLKSQESVLAACKINNAGTVAGKDASNYCKYHGTACSGYGS